MILEAIKVKKNPVDEVWTHNLSGRSNLYHHLATVTYVTFYQFFLYVNESQKMASCTPRFYISLTHHDDS